MSEGVWLVVQQIFMQLLSSCLLARVMVHSQMDFFDMFFITQHMNHEFYTRTYFIQKMILFVIIDLSSYTQTSTFLLVPSYLNYLFQVLLELTNSYLRHTGKYVK